MQQFLLSETRNREKSERRRKGANRDNGEYGEGCDESEKWVIGNGSRTRIAGRGSGEVLRQSKSIELI